MDMRNRDAAGHFSSHMDSQGSLVVSPYRQVWCGGLFLPYKILLKLVVNICSAH